MAENTTDLRLAAILALDVVGFSAMMNADELGTLRRVQALQKQIIAPLVDQFSGRIFKLIGDGVLANFADVGSAFECSKDILSKIELLDPSLRVRIGIHIDYVFFEDDDVFGDGVNIAARLEGVASPGAVAISERARKTMADSEHVFLDLGNIALKNIKDPVRVYLYKPGYTSRQAFAQQIVRISRLPLLFLLSLFIIFYVSYTLWRSYSTSPERIAKDALSGLACSWLGLQRVALVNGIPILEIEGASGQDATTLANKIRLDFARERKEVRVDIGNVSTLPESLCALVERFKNMRYGGPRRFDLLGVQQVNKFGIDLRKSSANRKIISFGEENRIKIRFYPEAYRSYSTLFIIRGGGEVEVAATLADLAKGIKSESNGTRSIDLTADPTSNAILIIDSGRPIPTDIIVDGKLDVQTFDRLERAASEGEWNVELNWFEAQSRSQGANPKRIGA